MVWKRFAIMAAALVAAGCASSTPNTATPNTEPLPPTTPLEHAIANWEEFGVDNYLIRAADIEQSPEGGCTWITEVHGDEIDTRWSALFDSDCGNGDISVPALHQEIVDRGSEVDWATTGVLTRIEFEAQGADGQGLSLTVEFQDLTGVQSIRTELAEARQRWAQAQIGSYRLEMVELQNYWFSGCRWINVVTDGVVTESSLDPDSADSSGSYCTETEWSVEKLHDTIAWYGDEIDQMSDLGFEGHTLDITFGEHGVPRYLKFDLSNAYDEESSLTVTLTPAG